MSSNWCSETRDCNSNKCSQPVSIESKTAVSEEHRSHVSAARKSRAVPLPPVCKILRISRIWTSPPKCLQTQEVTRKVLLWSNLAGLLAARVDPMLEAGGEGGRCFGVCMRSRLTGRHKLPRPDSGNNRSGAEPCQGRGSRLDVISVRQAVADRMSSHRRCLGDW